MKINLIIKRWCAYGNEPEDAEWTVYIQELDAKFTCYSETNILDETSKFVELLTGKLPDEVNILDNSPGYLW